MNATSAAIPYRLPDRLMTYQFADVFEDLVAARAAVEALRNLPYQRAWVEELQKMELKREVAGTSRIEGAEFTDRELEAALRETPEQLHTRSQRQARAAVQTYRWIATLPIDRPIDSDLVCEIHRRIVTQADEDHCEPGRLRRLDQNVTFGVPRHRGAEGGDECQRAFTKLCSSIEEEFRGHDPLIQALAAHYHFAAMHPFLDGNGRTARALEALMLQRAGLRDTCFIAMSNYYYDEKTAYLTALSAVRARDGDLTPFLRFGLQGIAAQSQRMAKEIKHQVSKGLYRNLMFDLFTRLKTPKRRVIAERQIDVLKILLEHESIDLEALATKADPAYRGLKSPRKALIRDLNDLIGLQAIRATRLESGRYTIDIRLEWPTEITESEFFAKLAALPKSKTHAFLQ